MRWFSSVVQGAGLARFGAASHAVSLIASTAVFCWLVWVAFKVVALAVFLGLGLLAFLVESLALLAKTRRRSLMKLWPEVIDSIHSAIVSGLTLPDAIDELSLNGPLRLRTAFQRFSRRLDTGWQFELAIDELKSEFGESHADQLCELLRLVSATGSESLASALKQQSVNLRNDLAFMGQIEAKQGWVAGTAKIAVAAPWLVVAMLSTRTENAVVYNSATGVFILFLGFVVSMFAYRLVHVLGSLPEIPRVFQ